MPVLKPVLLDIPESFETERLLIRAPRLGDGPAVCEAVHESLEELRPWMPFAEHPPTPEDSELHSREARLNYLARSDLLLRLYDKQTGKLIGSSGLHRIDWEAGKFEIGYWIRSSCSGHGYMTEAVNGITDFAVKELQANRVEIRCDARNIKSARVAERAGFRLEAVLRKEKRALDGTLRDTKVYAKVRGEEF